MDTLPLTLHDADLYSVAKGSSRPALPEGNPMMPRLFTLLVLFLPTCVTADSAPSSQISAESFALPGDRIRLPDGRALNLRCGGEGAPVVILEAGGNSDSSNWYRVLPRLARRSRVCAYDRVGYGFSDEGPLPRDLDADMKDLHALIEAAGIATPVVLVGHSLDSNIVRRFAQLHPQLTAGLVLVDPPGQGSDTAMPEEWRAQRAASVAQRESLLDAGEAASVAEDREMLLLVADGGAMTPTQHRFGREHAGDVAGSRT